MWNGKKRQRGVSLIAAIFIIVVLAFMGVIFVSLISTSTFTSLNDMQATQAFYTAEGGIEFGKAALAAYSSWYNFATDPYTLAANQALGSGAFTTTSNVPATTAAKSFGGGASVIRVFSIDRFPLGGGTIAIGGPGDIRTYAGTATGGGLGPRFTGVSAGVSAYPAGTTIYPVLILGAPGVGAADTTVPFIGDSSKFLGKGTLYIEDGANDEEITYTGIQTNPAQAFTGCERGANGSLASPHAAGLIILPLQSGQEVLITSDGAAGNARRVISDVSDQ
jgi:hypothetical protein